MWAQDESDLVVNPDLNQTDSELADTVHVSGPWPMKPGTHTLTWEWMRLFGHAPPESRDSAILYEIIVSGTV